MKLNSTLPKNNTPLKVYILIKWMSILLVGSLSLFSLLVIYHNVFPSRSHGTNFLDDISARLGFQEHKYIVVVDAGSTGSRCLAFKFHKSLTSDGTIKLDEQFFVQTKPGLSSYADDPVAGAASIKKLVEEAKAVIEESKWGETPLVLKATAGLRLLPEEKANLILEEIKKYFTVSGFVVSDASVSIMDGLSEGLFSWFTINFLLDRLDGREAETVAALDLGGGSTQITFLPRKQHTLEKAPKHHVHDVIMGDGKLGIYSHSYLGLGLMAARKDILISSPQNDSEIRSPCINPTVKTIWHYGGATYTLKGPYDFNFDSIEDGEWLKKDAKLPSANYEECLQRVANVVQEIHLLDELESVDITAISYYFDRATEQGLIDPFKGGSLTVQSFFQAARKACETPNADQPFACVDLLFISMLLRSFGLSPDKVINLHKQIDGYETSWALGAAVHILNNGI
ncbi:ectonucleoside triphosphate diphosphohydrolase 6-like isoform X2 [Artemia franciscana]|nr:hypothetical protein QYM36_015470 [Artemia franciscana]